MNNLRVIFSIKIAEIIIHKNNLETQNFGHITRGKIGVGVIKLDITFYLNSILNLGHCNVKINYNMTF